MIPNIFSRLFRDKSSSSPAPSNVQAKKRLQLALLYDKLDVSDEMVQSLQKDLVAVLSR
ncbi:cell division topological specificity factor MinE, partial [Desulfococcaceae bacterium OttesenSCG-928-F15]|nr:cell division topological specificity factor MinE [Desulfococcaceae bacterium OttesenSCG-928-F15]